MKLEIYNYFPDTTQHAKFQGHMSTWVVWEKASLTHESFGPFFRSSPGPRVASLDTTSMRNTSLYVVLAKVVHFGGYKDEI